MLFQKLTLIGVGLLGGSLGLAVKQRRLVATVHGYVRREASVAECRRVGAVDEATLDLEEAVRGAEVLVFCTPIGQMRPLAERLRGRVSPGTLVTDVGSVKETVVSELEPLFGECGADFVGSHPMAGSEKVGVAHATPDLYHRAMCVLTPTPRTAPEALARVRELWTGVGARTLELSPGRHDDLVSRCSHLPHVLAVSLANCVLDPAHPPEQALLCANGFRDTTRIASGSPEMWRDIAVANRQHLARAVAVFGEELSRFRHALEQGDEAALNQFLVRAKRARDAWVAQSLAPE